MRIPPFLVAPVIAVLIAAAGGTAAAATGSIDLPPDAVYPNGIAVAADGTLYIGQITAGGIAEREPDGSWRRLHPGADDVFAGTSLRLDERRGVLWGASPDFLPQGPERTPHVFAIDTESGRLLQSTPVDSGFGNDIAVEPSGSILVTESRGGRVLRHVLGSNTFTTVFADTRLTHPSGIGVAGIARADDGTLAVGNFGAGSVYVHDVDGLRELPLPRTLENPDGMAFTKDGDLVVLESAPQSGNGRVLLVPDPLERGPRDLVTLADGLLSPVNLSIGADGVAYVSESKVRHRIVEDLVGEAAPTAFRIVTVPTGGVHGVPR
jgi:hypothetical protein